MFYDKAYRLWPKDQPLPVNDQGECVVAKEVIITKIVKDEEITILRHTCSPKCKPLSQEAVDSILSLKKLMRLYRPCTNVIRVAQIRIITVCLDQMVLQNW